MKQCKYLLFLALFGCNQAKNVDLILYNGTFHTLSSDSSKKTAIVIDDGKILEVGNEELLVSYSGDQQIDLKGMPVYPGFIDAHCHFANYGLDKYKCKLFFTASFQEVLDRIKEYDKINKYAWIYGRGWDQNDWDVKEFPNNTEINKLYPDKPVILKRIDGHAMLVNKKALQMAGITESTIIQGGIIEKKNGKLTGILLDNAMDPVEKLVAALPETDAINFLKEAEKDCYKNGLTTVVDCGLELDNIEFLKVLYTDKTLTINNTILLSQDNETLEKYLTKGPFKIGPMYVSAVKIYADGALGSRGACLLEEYTDKPGYYGIMLSTVDKIREVAEEALQYNWQVCTHAIGDSANRSVLKLYSEILKGTNNKRWRIEHAQVVDPEDYIYIKNNNIIPSVQPTHSTSDMPWAGARLGAKRLPTAYAFKDLLQQSGTIALGTDFPVEELNPLATFYAAVFRKDRNGNPPMGFMKENALSRMEALKGMTTWAAYSVFRETETGTIEAGKYADLTILDKDIMTVAEDDILKTNVTYTIVRGEIKYSAKK